jgi:ArsR family transcriptional regulator
MTNIAEQLKALSDETRLRIVNLLYDKELCVCDILRVLGITQTKASRHLAYLKNNGFVKDRKEAQWSHYTLITKDNELLQILVENYLRKEIIYQEDLKNLKEYFKVKKED